MQLLRRMTTRKTHTKTTWYYRVNSEIPSDIPQSKRAISYTTSQSGHEAPDCKEARATYRNKRELAEASSPSPWAIIGSSVNDKPSPWTLIDRAVMFKSQTLSFELVCIDDKVKWLFYIYIHVKRDDTVVLYTCTLYRYRETELWAAEHLIISYKLAYLFNAQLETFFFAYTRDMTV